MKPIRITGQPATPYRVNELLRRFDYPDADTIAANPMVGGGGGMAHILIVSTSEPDFVQEKADYVVNEGLAGPELNAIFAGLDDGPWSIWMAGRFQVNENVSFPSGTWIRGLGFTSPGSA